MGQGFCQSCLPHVSDEFEVCEAKDAVSNPTSGSTCQSPLFLLFLDATWQLLDQYPAAFEFSEIYLAVLGDSTRISLFGTFLFNSPHQRVKQSTVRALRRAALLLTLY